MAERDGAGEFVAGLIVGGLVGAALALLFAPQSGPETRAHIRSASREIKERANETLAEAREKAEAITADARRRAEEMLNEARERADEITAEAMKTADELHISLSSKANSA
jgi:gas vesicle protein